MSQAFRYPSSSTSVSISAIGTNGLPAPATSIQVAGQDPSSDLQPLLLNASQELLVAVSALPLPAGAATLAEQQAQTALLTTIDGDTAAIAVSTSSIDSKLGSLGQALMAASAPVVIASDQSTLPVSLASVPLPSGAATLAEQQAQTALLTTIDADTGSIDSKTPALVSGRVPVDVGASVLPTGAATEATLASLDGKVPAQGQAAMAASMPVVIASDQSAIPVSIAAAPAVTGRSLVTSVRNDYSSVNVTTGAWVQLIASTASVVNQIFVFDSSGQTMELGVGPAASEVRVSIIVPGGNGDIPLAIPASSRVSIRAISATASVGEIDINLYS